MCLLFIDNKQYCLPIPKPELFVATIILCSLLIAFFIIFKNSISLIDNLIANVLNQSADDNNFANPIKLDVFTSLEVVFAYTNISFTEKQKEDLVKLYDLLESNGIFNMIIAEIPKTEYTSIVDGVAECANAVYTYRNSIMGILDTITQDYDTLDFDINSLRDKLSSTENLTLLKDIMTKLG